MERSLILTKGRTIIRNTQKLQSMCRPHVMDYVHPVFVTNLRRLVSSTIPGQCVSINLLYIQMDEQMLKFYNTIDNVWY